MLWYGFDEPDTRIEAFAVAVGTGCGLGRASDVLDWLELEGESDSEAAEAPYQALLELPEGVLLQHMHTYYVSVKARNSVFLWSEVACSPAVYIDLTPPRFVSPPVHSERMGEASVWFSGPDLPVSWRCVDDESGVGYQVPPSAPAMLGVLRRRRERAGFPPVPPPPQLL